MKYVNHNHQQGQALITLLFFVLIATIIASASIVIMLNNSKAATNLEQGMGAYYIAEDGIENAVLRLLRDPAYTGETLTLNGGSAVITVTSGSPITITSVGTTGNFKRTIRATAQFSSSNTLSILSWRELF